MGFIEQLAKGFIRSSVNQVGRDGGKVISNKIYGDKHSTPIRLTSSQQNMYKIESDGVELTKSADWSIFNVIMGVILSFILPFLGSAILIYRSIVNMNRKTITYNKKEERAVYAPDRRYKTGSRYEGYRTVYIPVQVEASEQQIKKMKIKGVLYLITGVSVAVFYVVKFYFTK